jgi:hypothetical protein
VKAFLLKPEPWVELSPMPWWCADDIGVVYDADSTPICVLGDPNRDLDLQDIRNGAVILAAPAMLVALKALQAVRPFNWADDEDPEHVAAWTAADAAVLLAEPAP